MLSGCICYSLIDGLDPNQTPILDHMMLEKSPDEAFQQYLSEEFIIRGRLATIGFINMTVIECEDVALRLFEETLKRGDISLFSFDIYEKKNALEQMKEKIDIQVTLSNFTKPMQGKWTIEILNPALKTPEMAKGLIELARRHLRMNLGHPHSRSNPK